MAPAFARDSIIRLRAPQVMDHGSLVSDWDNATEATLTGWLLQPGASLEDLTNRQGVSIEWTAYGPYDADVIASDRIRLPSGDYSVIGEPERWKSPTGRLNACKVLLRRWSENG